MTNLRKILVPFIVLTLLLGSFVTQSLATNHRLCVPGDTSMVIASTSPIQINVDDGTLKSKFIYPRPDASSDFPAGSLGGIAMTHGTGTGAWAVENEAHSAWPPCAWWCSPTTTEGRGSIMMLIPASPSMGIQSAMI